MPSNFQLWANATLTNGAPHRRPQKDEKSNKTMIRYCDNVYNLSGVNYRRRHSTPKKNISQGSLIHMMPWKRKLLGLKPTGTIPVEEEESSSSADDVVVRSRTCCSWNGASGSPDAAPYDTASTSGQKVSIDVLVTGVTAGGYYSTDFPEPTQTSPPFRTSRRAPQLRILKPLAVNSPYELLRAGNYLEKPAAKAKIFLLKNAGAVSSNVSIVTSLPFPLQSSLLPHHVFSYKFIIIIFLCMFRSCLRILT